MNCLLLREVGMESSPSNLPTEGPTFRRVEVLSGVARRRRSEGEKASIVAESLAPGAVARQVALRHGLHPNQLYMWRRELGGRSYGRRRGSRVQLRACGALAAWGRADERAGGWRGDRGRRGG